MFSSATMSIAIGIINSVVHLTGTTITISVVVTVTIVIISIIVAMICSKV